MEFKEPSDIFQYIKKNKWFFALLVGLTFLVYANILDNSFVADDIAVILKNKEWAVEGGTFYQFRYNTFLKDFIYSFFGPSRFVYHFVSIIFHVFCSALVFFFTAGIVRKEKLAKATALLFALHPVHTEAVAWASASHYLIYSVLFLLSFLFFHFQLERKDSSRLVLASLFFYTLALLSSVWALPLAMLFFLYEKYLREKNWKNLSWIFYSLLAVLIVGYLLVMWGPAVERVSGLSLEHDSLFFPQLVTAVPHSLAQYLKLLFWPMKLSLYHEGFVLTQGYIWISRFVTVFFLVALLLVLRKKRIFIFLFLLFVLALLPALSPVQIASFVAERYLYFSSISFCVFLFWFFLWVEKKTKWQGLAVFLLMLTAAFYSVRTVIRNNDWQSRASLWFATARTNPRSPRVHNNLGDIYTERGDFNKAIEEFEKARRLRPGYADATHNLALTYLRRGDLAEAKKYFQEALKYEPNLYQSYYMLGVISYEEGNPEKARELFRQALEINPNYTPAHQALQEIYKP